MVYLKSFTETALVRVTSDLFTAFYNGLISVVDLSAVFSTSTDHKMLLQRLEHTLGIKGTALQWPELYLTDR